jgi:hypothetical protein
VGLHRRADAEVAAVADDRPDELVVEEARVGAHQERSPVPGPPAARNRLLEEPRGAVLGVGGAAAKTGVDHVPACGRGGEDRVVTQHPGVAVLGPAPGLAMDRRDRGVRRMYVHFYVAAVPAFPVVAIATAIGRRGKVLARWSIAPTTQKP